MYSAEEISKVAFAKIDTMDAEKVVSSMTDDVTFVFADQPPVVAART